MLAEVSSVKGEFHKENDSMRGAGGAGPFFSLPASSQVMQ